MLEYMSKYTSWHVMVDMLSSVSEILSCSLSGLLPHIQSGILSDICQVTFLWGSGTQEELWWNKFKFSLQQGYWMNTPNCKTLFSKIWSILTHTFLDATPRFSSGLWCQSSKFLNEIRVQSVHQVYDFTKMRKDPCQMKSCCLTTYLSNLIVLVTIFPFTPRPPFRGNIVVLMNSTWCSPGYLPRFHYAFTSVKNFTELSPGVQPGFWMSPSCRDLFAKFQEFTMFRPVVHLVLTKFNDSILIAKITKFSPRFDQVSEFHKVFTTL